MLVTPESDQRNRKQALTATGAIALAVGVAGLVHYPLLLIAGMCPIIYWLFRRRYLRRLAAMDRPFPPAWEQTLRSHVRFFNSLDDLEKERFRQMVKVFLDEVTITGVRTIIDDTVRVLVAASAVIPIFGFHDWEYHRLREVLVYPESFGEHYQTNGKPDENTLGMIGLKHLSGVMILSKPALFAGFDNPASADHVGVHEFAHLVENEEADYGLPPEVPLPVVKEWLKFVAGELAHHPRNRLHINDYAYTNEHEFFAVLAEYFFKSPQLLEQKDPKLYRMLRDMFHQDPRALLT
jgi:Mlc titration factor MtfA (ptsG expression regulator)